MTSSDLKQLELPDNPGVYFFRDSAGVILYIGRATSLRDRTRSYFARDLASTRGPHMVHMVRSAATVTWEATPTVMDAILLESALIHANKPYYNTKEKDDKSGTYIIITKEAFPRIFTERWRTYTMHADQYVGAELYGPFTSAAAAQDILRFIRKSLPFLDKKSNQKHHTRFYQQLGLVPQTGGGEEQVSASSSQTFAAASTNTASTLYKKRIALIKKILGGKRSDAIAEMTTWMQSAAAKHDYELAAKYRDAIRALGRVSDMKFIRASIAENFGSQLRIEAYDTSHFGGKSHMGVMTVLENGEPAKSEYRSFIIRSAGAADDIAATAELLARRLRHPEWPMPNYIVIDGGQTHLHILTDVIRSHGASTDNIQIVSIVKDEHHKPRELLSEQPVPPEIEKLCILANSEAHRFAIKVMHTRNRAQTLAKKS